MEFKKLVAGHNSYGISSTDKLANPQMEVDGVTNVNFTDPFFVDHMNNENHHNHANIQRFIRILGLCHTVIVDEKEDRSIIYNASSPDELALVNGARYFGFMFAGRDVDNNMIIKRS